MDVLDSQAVELEVSSEVIGASVYHSYDGEGVWEGR